MDLELMKTLHYLLVVANGKPFVAHQRKINIIVENQIATSENQGPCQEYPGPLDL
jgi:hypothetical protein